MRILGVDLGRFNRSARVCLLVSESGEIEEGAVPTTPKGIAQAIARWRPDQVVVEPCTATGWVADACRQANCRLLVADTNHPAWRHRDRRRKTDEDDARLLAQLAAMRQLGAVHVPEPAIREWRALIAYRARVVADRGRIQNRIRWVLERHGVETPPGHKAWSQRQRAALEAEGKPYGSCTPDERWRGTVALELLRLKNTEEAVAAIEADLDRQAATDPRVARLRSVPGVGPRLSELIVALIDDPRRFRNGRQVGAYVGLVPRRHQSGETDRRGGIDKHGNRLLRAFLVEVAWLCLRHNTWARDTYRRINGTGNTDKNRAVTAVARQLLVRCWAMLRDGTTWREPTAADLARDLDTIAADDAAGSTATASAATRKAKPSRTTPGRRSVSTAKTRDSAMT